MILGYRTASFSFEFLYFPVAAHAFPNSDENRSQQHDNSEADSDGEELEKEHEHHSRNLIAFTNAAKKIHDQIFSNDRSRAAIGSGSSRLHLSIADGGASGKSSGKARDVS